jgi:hypothetical protein
MAALFFLPSQQPAPAAATPQPIQFTPPPLPERRRKSLLALFWQFRLLTVPLVLVTALAIGLAAWAFTTTTEQRETGTFSVDAADVSLEVLTYQIGGTTNTLDASTAWCQGPSLEVGTVVYCSVSVRNLSPQAIQYSLETLGVDMSLAGALDVEIRTAGQPSGCKAAIDGSTGSLVFSGKLSATEFGDPLPGADAGDRALVGGLPQPAAPPAGSLETLCFGISYDGSPSAQGGSTSATFKFDADDDEP